MKSGWRVLTRRELRRLTVGRREAVLAEVEMVNEDSGSVIKLLSIGEGVPGRRVFSIDIRREVLAELLRGFLTVKGPDNRPSGVREATQHNI